MITSKVEICGVNTSKLPVLTAAEKRELFPKIKAGDRAARDKFIKGNLRLVLSIIGRFGNRGEYADDLFQVGCVGLIKAIDNFDLNQNVQFSTYAVPMIIGEIRRYLRDNNSVRVSRSLRDIAYKALCVKEKMMTQAQREPTVDEIAKALEVPREDVVAALDAVQEPISLFEPVYHDGGDTVFVMDQVSDEKNLDEIWIEQISLREALDKLPDKERTIVDFRFFKGKTQTEVAAEIGISQAQVSRIEKSAIEHLRKNLT